MKFQQLVIGLSAILFIACGSISNEIKGTSGQEDGYDADLENGNNASNSGDTSTTPKVDGKPDAKADAKPADVKDPSPEDELNPKSPAYKPEKLAEDDKIFCDVGDKFSAECQIQNPLANLGPNACEQALGFAGVDTKTRLAECFAKDCAEARECLQGGNGGFGGGRY